MILPEDAELLKTPKEELERIKLALEISSYQEDRKTARRKSWGETTRLVIMALFAAVLSLGSTYLLKVYDHDTSAMDSARSRLASLKGELASNLLDRKKDSIICLIGSIDVPGDNRKLQTAVDSFQRQCQQSQILNADNEKNRKTIKQTDKHFDQTTPEAIAVTKKLDQDDAKLMQLQIQLNSKNAALQRQAQTKSDELTKSSTAAAPPEIKSAVQSSADISSVAGKLDVATSIPNSTATEKIYPVFWVKKGYFILFDQFRVSLIDLRNGSAQVQACYQTADGECDTIALPDEGIFNTQKTLDFKYKGTSYSLVLQKVDHAGVNPFKLAAYINLVQKAN